MIAGVIWPLMVILLEAITGIWSQMVYDPLISPWHWLLVLSVPAANLAAGGLKHDWVDILLGFALVSAAFYCFALGPFFLFIAILLSIFGVGFVLWAPVFALWVAIHHTLRRLRGEGESMRLLVGAALAIVVLLAGEAPAAEAIRLAQLPNGVPVRAVLPGTASALLHLCQSKTHYPGEMVTWGFNGRNDVAVGQACETYYWLTGTLAPPDPKQVRFWLSDENQGQTRTGDTLPNLRIADSEMRAVIDPKTGIEDIDWRIEFANDAQWQQEARLKIALPPSGAVVGASLWVDDEEREARFGASKVVKAAYQKVAIAQRRDPLLVTWAGRDQVFAQAFPVPPRGRMRIRLRIAAPVTGKARLPRIIEKNLEWNGPGRVETSGEGPVSYGPQLDPRDPAFAVRLAPAKSDVPKRITVVVDSSSWMQTHAHQLKQTLAAWGQQTELKASITHFEGGADNAPTLEKALRETPDGGTVIWIHGPQPYPGRSTLGLEEQLNRPLSLWTVRLEPGANLVLQAIEKKNHVQALRSLNESLQAMLPEQWLVYREPATGQAAPPGHAAALWASTQSPDTAARYHVITRDVGAVVLETDLQYTQNGLDENNDKPISATPEPATWGGVGLGLLLILYFKKGLCRASSPTVVSGP